MARATVDQAAVRSWVVRDLRDSITRTCPQHIDVVPDDITAQLTGRRGWVPADALLSIQAALFARGGRTLLLEVSGQTAWASNLGRFTGALVGAALFSIRNRPERLFAWLPWLRARATRAMGRSVYTETARGCRLTLCDLPAAVLHHEPYILGVVGSYQALLQFIRVAGTVEVETVGDEVVFDIVWGRAAAKDPPA